LDPEQLQILSRAEFCASLRADIPAEQWLAELLIDCTDDEVKIAVIREPVLEGCHQRLFYSEPLVFQRYLDNGEIPMERQLRTFLITDLPESLLELKPRRFWHFWVSSPETSHS
jgi:hypothetical protein